MTTDFFKESDSDNPWTQNKGWISIDKANRLLKECGIVVSGGTKILDNGTFDNPWDKIPDGTTPRPPDTHQGLLINIEPIEKDSAEKFVSDWLKHDGTYSYDEMADRARKLIGGSK